MQFDRPIKISISNNRFEMYKPLNCMLAEFYSRLSSPVRGSERRSTYMSLPKKKQDDLKDVGGFVGGELIGGIRKNGHVAGRDLITLDIDNIEANGTNNVLTRLSALGAGYAVYSTRKHGVEAPRLRAIFPLDRTITADEYEAVARKIAYLIDPTMQVFDRTTFQPHRLMYWPSVCADGEYIFQYEDKPLASADGLLASYQQWRDIQQWHRCPSEGTAQHKAAEKQERPNEKSGIVGAFCRVYDIPTVIEHFQLPYEACATGERYTYTKGSTTGGAVMYENGLFLYSNHATDPAGGNLCNTFDLVRLHLYSEQDNEAKAGTPVSKLPSYMAMCKLASADASVYEQLNNDREDNIKREFAEYITPDTTDINTVTTQAPQESSLKFKVKYNDKGIPEKTIDNAWSLMELDPVLKGKVVLDVFAGRGIAIGPYPWNAALGRRIWTDTDDDGMQWYLEKCYSYRHQSNVYSALRLCGQHHAVDPVRDYLESLQWDGIPRLDSLFIDYLGARDSAYTRTITRKAFVAAVARIFKPGCKYDTMLILTGPTGIGKSTILRKMGKDWFSDSLQSFEGKEARELIQGVWLVEIGELGYMNKTESNQVKQFLSQQEDIYRAAYGRNAENHARRCVFFGTTNEYDYLKDNTGNRRFWPLDVGEGDITKNVFKELTPTEINYIWAEAVARFHLGEPLHLEGDVADEAIKQQELHRATNTREGMILEYLDAMIPLEYDTWDDVQKSAWDNGVMQLNPSQEQSLQQRQRVCAAEIWEKVFRSEVKLMKQTDTREINSIVKRQKGWKKSALRCGKYGTQRGYIRYT